MPHTLDMPGVRILIHNALSYTLLDMRINPEGRYVLLHVVVDTFEMLILGLYIPLPATVSLLKYLTPVLSGYPTDNLIIAGDFNIALIPSLDRLSSDNSSDSPLHRWASLYGLIDVWRLRYPNDRAFTCHSTS